MRKYIFTAVLLMLVFLSACTPPSSEGEEIKQIIEKELGINPYIPDDDLIGAVIMNYYHALDNNSDAGKGDPFQVEIEYKASTEEKLDEKMKEVWDDRDPLREVVYGDLYMDPNVCKVTIFKDGVPEIMAAELIELEGHEVQYQHIERDSEAVIMAIDFEEYGYMIEYYLEEGRTEEDAQVFAEDIIRNID